MKTRLPFLLIVAVLFWLAGCSSDSPADAPTAVPAVPVSGQPAAAPAAAPTAVPAAVPTVVPTAAPVQAVAPVLASDPREAILAAMRAMISRPFRSHSTITGEGFSMDITGEFSPPDGMRILTQLKDSPEREMIVIGSQGWQRAGAEGWTPMPPEVVTMVNEQGGLAPNMAMLEASITSALLVGPEVLDGVDAMVYTISTIFDAGKPTEIASDGKLWIDTSRGLPIRQEMKSGGTLTVQTIDYENVAPVTAP